MESATNPQAGGNQQTNTTPPNTQNTASNWPGAFGIYQYSRNAVMRNVWMLVTLILISAVVSFIIARFHLGIIGSLISIIVSSVITVFTTRILLAGVRGMQLTSDDLFTDDIAQLSLQMIGLNLLLVAVGALSLMLFIVPFFFIFPRLVLAPYFLVDKHLGVFGSLNASWAATQGSVGKIYGIIGVGVLMGLLFVTIIGIPVAIYLLFMYSAALAVLYEYLNEHTPAVG